MKFLILLSKIGRKTHTRHIIRAVLRVFAIFSKSTKYNEQAEDVLQKFSADNGGTILHKNEIAEHPQYDLQIIIPVYNTYSYVKECMDSVLSQQTQYRYKVVVIDDGSTDGSGKLVEQLYGTDNRVEFLHQENQGQSVARNKSLQHINAKYVLFVDSDDVLVPNAVENMLSVAYKENADIVGGGFYSFSEKKILYTSNPKEMTGFACGKIIKSNLFRNVCYPVGYKYEDTIISMVLFHLAKKMIHLPVVVFGYRKNLQSTSHTAHRSLRIIDLHWITKRILQERISLGIINDDKLYNQFLKQVWFNADHILMLNDKSVGLALMWASEKLRRTYFADFKCSQEFKGIDRALKEQNYSKFLVETLFY